MQREPRQPAAGCWQCAWLAAHLSSRQREVFKLQLKILASLHGQGNGCDDACPLHDMVPGWRLGKECSNALHGLAAAGVHADARPGALWSLHTAEEAALPLLHGRTEAQAHGAAI